MTAAHRRGAALERSAARHLGTRRVRPRRGVSAPDVEPVRLPSGVVLSVECKKRGRAPALLLRALEQAKRYLPSAVPAVVFAPTGEPPLIVLSLDVFRRIAGLAPVEPAPQLPLPLRAAGGASDG